MISPVIIKGNKQGIRIIIHQDATLIQILDELQEKLQSTKRYYKSIRPISVTFEGKNLTEDENLQIINTLQDIGLNIQKNQNSQIEKEKTNLQSDNNKRNNEGLFYLGTLKNGQSLEACTSIVIVGNIEAGASVISEGNIVVIGDIKGYVQAGYKGKKDAFVYSLKEDL